MIYDGKRMLRFFYESGSKPFILFLCYSAEVREYLNLFSSGFIPYCHSIIWCSIWIFDRWAALANGSPKLQTICLQDTRLIILSIEDVLSLVMRVIVIAIVCAESRTVGEIYITVLRVLQNFLKKNTSVVVPQKYL